MTAKAGSSFVFHHDMKIKPSIVRRVRLDDLITDTTDSMISESILLHKRAASVI